MVGVLQLQRSYVEALKKIIICLVIVKICICAGQTSESSSTDIKCGNDLCLNGECLDSKCSCFAGWKGPSCQLCGGRVRLTESEGVITHGVGNYSSNMQCTWLIDGPEGNGTVQLYIDDFSTECGFDRVYIFDGDSAYDEQLAVYSGTVQPGGYASHKLRSLEAKSGAAYLLFQSDGATNMAGFRIAYRYNSCPSVSSQLNCSGNGACDPESGRCTCDAGWGGRACSVPFCPRDCSGHGTCDPQEHRCVCQPGFRGRDCSQREEAGVWELLPSSQYVPPGRASHAAVVKDDSVWLLGGETFTDADFVIKYDIIGEAWERVHPHTGEQPTPRYGHSAVLRGDTVYMYGGVMRPSDSVPREITSELWALDTTTRSWERRQMVPDLCYRDVCGPLPVVGHSAVVVGDDRMLLLFGHSPVYGYLNYVQSYRFDTGEWSVHQPGGALVKGSYGHSSVWDARSRLVYVYGGRLSDNSYTSSLSNLLHALDPSTMEWTRLSSAVSSRYLHSAVLLDGLMLVHGGSTYNGSSDGHGARCYSHSFLAYDPGYDRWHELTAPPQLDHDLSRYGHAAVVFNGSMLVVGGYNGRMLGDIVRFTPGRCGAYSSRESCLASGRAAAKCGWDVEAGQCLPTAPSASEPHEQYLLEEGGPSASARCAALSSCSTCVHSEHNCTWCGSTCAHRNCADNVRPIRSADQCQRERARSCALLHNCDACHTEPHCTWEADNRCYLQPAAHNTEPVGGTERSPCGAPCSQRTTCHDCTAASCLWCGHQSRCVERNAYEASFPYGQCMEYTLQEEKCEVIPEEGGSPCSAHHTCQRCQEDPGCGWCDNGSGTGQGVCLRGGYNRPHELACPGPQWSFFSCPSCQCNGHSTCYPGNSTCQSCGDLTAGEHCHTCQNGSFGDPLNGGKCQPCDCNGHGTDCHPETGECQCTTKGVVGDRCERCDSFNNYNGDPANGGQCFYRLTQDYQFTFDLTRPKDLHFERISFMNRPASQDLDTEFNITCSKPAKFNITVQTGLEPERVILSDYDCSQYKQTFTQSEFSFGTSDNTTFYVSVYQLRPPLVVQVAFSQPPRLNLFSLFTSAASAADRLFG